MKNNENKRTAGSLSPFNLAYSAGWVLILLRAAGIIAISWHSIVMYYFILAFATAIILTLAALIALIGGSHIE